MAIPKVFISSTCYDLAEERAQLERFVSSYGFQPILSEFNDVFFNPDEHTHESCVKEVINCDLFILVISGRFGGKYIKGTGESITQAEYNEARKQKIPIFAFVKGSVLEAQLYYKENIKTNNLEFANKINYPAITKQSDSESIFKFIESVQRASENNAIESYLSFTDIENHLRKQWAGLFYSFLQKRKDQRDVEHISAVLEQLSISSSKLESLVENIHTKEFDEAKTLDSINKSIIKKEVDNFFEIVKAFSDEIYMNNKAQYYTESFLNKAIDCNPKKYLDLVQYLNEIKLIGADVYYDKKQYLFKINNEVTFSISMNAPIMLDLIKSYNGGVLKSGGKNISESIFKYFGEYINNKI